MSSIDDVLNELHRILAECDQAQAMIDEARIRFRGDEPAQMKLDRQQVHLDTTRSQLRVGVRRARHLAGL